MRYAKLVDGYPSYHGVRNPIVNDDRSKTITKNEALLLAAGFLPVLETPMPDGGVYIDLWEETDSAIVQVWSEAPEMEILI